MEEKIAVLTGTSSGIGLVAALELARAGFRVVATMRNLEKRGALEEAARHEGVAERVEVRKLDVTDHASLPGFVEAVARDHGRIDVLVNNAGFSMAGFAEDLTVGEVREQFETNFFGHVAVTQAVLPVMRRQRSGTIIMVTSISGLVGQPVISAYSASKHALEGWGESLRIENRPLGIHVVLVEPGAFETEIWVKNVKLGARCLQPESPNYERFRRFGEFVQTKVTKADAREVGRLIARIARHPRPKLRYVIGKDAHAQLWLKRLLPWRLYEKLVAKAVRIDKC